MTVVVVLLLISVTLAMSYGMMRSELTAARIQANGDRGELARQAALTGINMALRVMHESARWTGVGTTLSGSLSTTETYSVAFSTGDASLSTAGADYWEYPYRVTLRSTGVAKDPTNPAQQSTHVIEAVARLAPRALGTQPVDWNKMQQYTVNQRDERHFYIEPPCRVEGPIRIQGDVRTGDRYSWSNDARTRYMSDLKSLYLGGGGDFRPVTGPFYLPFSASSSSALSLLGDSLGIQLIDTPKSSAPTIPFPSALASYQLYAGGQVYKVPQLGATLSNVTLAANPATNPLGLFFRDTGIVLGENVSVTGTIILSGSMALTGVNTQLSTPDHLGLTTATGPVRLPAVVARNSLNIESTAATAVKGNLLLGDNFLAYTAPVANTFSIVGRIICGDFYILERSEWKLSGGDWDLLWNAFKAQLTLPAGVRIDSFPLWLAAGGWKPNPVLTFIPPAEQFTAHWQDFSTPMYVPAAGDSGLRWELLRMSAAK